GVTAERRATAAKKKATPAMPMPPYSSRPAQRQVTEAHVNRRPPQRSPYFEPANIPPTILTRDPGAGTYEAIGPEIPIGPAADAKDGLISAIDTRGQPKRPDPPPAQERVVIGHIDQAMLVRRIEPVYPTIPKQLHRSGRVELHAVIAMDGTIQSLEVVSGDPMFVPSALDAVR